MRTMIRQRCPRCDSNMFLSDDPLDGPGTLYCLAGHTFYTNQSRPAIEPVAAKRSTKAA